MQMQPSLRTLLRKDLFSNTQKVGHICERIKGVMATESFDKELRGVQGHWDTIGHMNDKHIKIASEINFSKARKCSIRKKRVQIRTIERCQTNSHSSTFALIH